MTTTYLPVAFPPDRDKWDFNQSRSNYGLPVVDAFGKAACSTHAGCGYQLPAAHGPNERELGLEVRVGLHTGECELMDGKVAGIAVHTGARVAANAQPGEVLVSSTVKDLVAGSGLAFEDRGQHELKGIPGEWRLYAIER